MSSERFEILLGLPATGPPAFAIRAGDGGWSGHSEGFVVRFTSRAGETWVGNFQTRWRGWTGCLDHPDGRHVIVVAGGHSYLVDPNRPGFAEVHHPPIAYAVAVRELNAVIVFDRMRFAAWTSEGIWWQSEPIDWIEVRDVEVESDHLRGRFLAYDYLASNGELQKPFSLDLRTGKLTRAQDVQSEPRMFIRLVSKRSSGPVEEVPAACGVLVMLQRELAIGGWGKMASLKAFWSQFCGAGRQTGAEVAPPAASG